MKIKDKSLSEQFTLQIITSRDLNHALHKMYHFLKKHFALDLVAIWIYNARQGTILFKTIITEDDISFLDEKVKLSSAGQERTLDSIKTNVETWHKSPGKDAMLMDIAKHFSFEDTLSSIRAVTRLDDFNYGGISLSAFGAGRYKKEDTKRMEELFDALAGAVRHLLNQLKTTNERDRLTIEIQELHKRLRNRIVGEKSGLQSVMEHVNRVAPLESPVLIMGETGVGKEIIASAIHQRSNKSQGPLISFNCGAIPETLIESELFGYEKGAFTGATEMKCGYFEQADTGTIFMDEIGELSLKAQVKLLRFLQTMKFQRVGGSRPLTIDTRVIAASNRNLEEMVRESQFRDDLWYRLNVYPIYIPPLRERKNDIPELALYFARVKSNEMNLPNDFSFAPQAMEQLKAYHWPGNVRELQNIIERGLIINSGKLLSFPDLDSNQGKIMEEKLSPGKTHFPTLDEMISQHIRESIVLSKGKIEGPGGAAELLGLHPSTLRAKIKKFGIEKGLTS